MSETSRAFTCRSLGGEPRSIQRKLAGNVSLGSAATGSWPDLRRWRAATTTGNLASRRSVLRTLASWLLSDVSGSQWASRLHAERRTSIVGALAGILRSVSMISGGTFAAAPSRERNWADCGVVG